MGNLDPNEYSSKIEVVPLSTLKPNPSNARQHSNAQVEKLAASIREFGFTVPLLIDGEGGVIAGHGRLEAARLLGLGHVPIIKIDYLTAEQQKAYRIADNRLTELASWDGELLALELQGLAKLELDFNLEITGFNAPEIDFLIQGLADDESDDADEIPESDPARPTVSARGDLWEMGPHRLYCGDALEADSYGRLLGDKKAQLVFADLPYNLKISDISGRGRIQHREFENASGELSREEFEAFLKTSLGHMASHSVDGAIQFICMGWQSVHALLNAGQEVYSELKNICVWCKTNAGMGSLYRGQHEFVLVFKHGKAPHVNNVALGRLPAQLAYRGDCPCALQRGSGHGWAADHHPAAAVSQVDMHIGGLRGLDAGP